MKEIINLISEVLFIPIPLPISFSEVPMYYNLFGLIVVSFVVGLCALLIKGLYGSSNGGS